MLLVGLKVRLTATVVLNDLRSIIQSMVLGDATVISYLVPENKENVWVIQGPNKNPAILVHYQIDSFDEGEGERNCLTETILGSEERNLPSNVKEELACRATVAPVSCQRASNITHVGRGDEPTPISLGGTDRSQSPETAGPESFSMQAEQELRPSFSKLASDHIVVERDVLDNYIVVSASELVQEATLAPLIPIVEHAYAIKTEPTDDVISGSNLTVTCTDKFDGQLTSSPSAITGEEVCCLVQSTRDPEVILDKSVSNNELGQNVTNVGVEIAIEDSSVHQLDASAWEAIPNIVQQSDDTPSADKVKTGSSICRYCSGVFEDTAMRILHEKHCACKQVKEDLERTVKHEFPIACKRELLECELQDDVLIESLPQSANCDSLVQQQNSPQHTTVTHAVQIVPGQQSAGKRAQCSFCEKTFSRPTYQKVHERIHTGERPYQCSYCPKTFYIPSHRKQHERAHTGEWPYQCSYCDKKFSQCYSKTAHERTHTGETRYQCPYCDKKFSTLGNQKCHERAHAGDSSRSSIGGYCGEGLQNSAKGTVHKRRDCKQVKEDHERTVEQEFRKRELQDDVLHVMETLSESAHRDSVVQQRNRTQRTKLTHAEKNVPRHLSTGKRYQCSFCDKTFSTMTNQKIHERTHTGERPYKCTYCTKTFYIVSHKKRHEITHTGDKPHQCSFCEKTFSTIANQKRHERTHTGEKPYRCSHCDKTFSQSDSLKAHERTHTGEKPYHCAHCDKTFSQYCSKLLHERIHTGEKPYQCSHCDRKFAHSSQKKSHEKSHTVSVS